MGRRLIGFQNLIGFDNQTNLLVTLFYSIDLGFRSKSTFNDWELEWKFIWRFPSFSLENVPCSIPFFFEEFWQKSSSWLSAESVYLFRLLKLVFSWILIYTNIWSWLSAEFCPLQTLEAHFQLNPYRYKQPRVIFSWIHPITNIWSLLLAESRLTLKKWITAVTDTWSLLLAE